MRGGAARLSKGNNGTPGEREAEGGKGGGGQDQG